MNVVSVLTLRLAEIIGLYMIVVGIGGLASPHRWRAVMDDLNRSPGLVIVLGFAVFAVGGTLVLIHNVWTDPLSIAVSLVGYVALIEGATLLAVPDPLIRVGYWSLGFIRSWAGTALVLGLFLFVAGLTGRVPVSV